MIIQLPWFPAELHPNARVHWAKKAKHTKAYRLACWAAAIQQKPGGIIKPSGKIHLDILFMPPNKCKRDIDGCLSAIKAALDGLADAWGVDDSRFRYSLDIGESVKHGAVMIEIAGRG